jgi:hypothetical protein
MTDTLFGGAAMPEAFDAVPHLSPFVAPEHPCTVVFREAMTSQMLKTAGANLHLLAEGDKFQLAARRVRNFFAPELGIASSRIFPSNIPHFLLAADSSAEPAIDPTLFAAEITALSMAKPDGACAVARNLGWLQELLHLTSFERKLLLWTYCGGREPSATATLLGGVLGCVQCQNWIDVIEALAILLDEPVMAVAECLVLPCRLRAMRLILMDTRKAPANVAECLDASDTLIEVLETLHRSKEALLFDLLQPRPLWWLQPESDIPDVLITEWFDEPVADMLIAAANSRPLTAPQIATAITWLTGWPLSVEQCETLAGHLTFDVIERTIQRCFVEYSQRDEPVTRLALMQALYASATP